MSECEWFLRPEAYWTKHYGAIEPGSTHEYNPDCPEHGETMSDDPTNPDYYKFPSGAEVIDISENLTGNGAQIVQYTARATRTDGKVKGNPIEDLAKARWFIGREIDRLEKANRPS